MPHSQIRGFSQRAGSGRADLSAFQGQTQNRSTSHQDRITAGHRADYTHLLMVGEAKFPRGINCTTGAHAVKWFERQTQKEQTKQHCPGLCTNLQMSQLTSGFHPSCTPLSCLLHALNVCADFARSPASKTGLCSPAQRLATPAPGRSRGLSCARVHLPTLSHLCGR